MPSCWRIGRSMHRPTDSPPWILGHLLLTTTQCWRGVFRSQEQHMVKVVMEEWEAVLERMGVLRRMAALPYCVARSSMSILRYHHCQPNQLILPVMPMGTPKLLSIHTGQSLRSMQNMRAEVVATLKAVVREAATGFLRRAPGEECKSQQQSVWLHDNLWSGMMAYLQVLKRR